MKNNMEGNISELIYFLIAVVFVVMQGICWPKWWPSATKSNGIEYIKQALLNTLGSIIGWYSGYYLIFVRLKEIGSGSIEGSDFILMMLFFYGATGHLPYITLGKLSEFIELVKKYPFKN